MVDKVDDDIYETCLYTILAYQQQQHGEDKQCSHCILMLDLYQPYIRYDVCSKKIKIARVVSMKNIKWAFGDG